MAVARQGIVRIELAETAAERDVLLARDLLLAEQQDPAFQECAMDPIELGIGERLGEVDALHFRAEGVGERPQGNRHAEVFLLLEFILPIIAD
jgi:hypothetical protein